MRRLTPAAQEPATTATMTLLDLAGSVALLLWGIHMVQSGVQRALGPNLRRVMAAALGSAPGGALVDTAQRFVSGLDRT